MNVVDTTLLVVTSYNLVNDADLSLYDENYQHQHYLLVITFHQSLNELYGYIIKNAAKFSRRPIYTCFRSNLMTGKVEYPQINK